MLLFIGNRTIRQDSCLWWDLWTTMLGNRVPAICFSSSTTAIMLICSLGIKLYLVWDPASPTNCKKVERMISICLQNLLNVSELQKRAHNKGVKPWSYAQGKKVWLDRKYINKNKIQSSRPSSLLYSKFFVKWASRHTSFNYESSKKFIISSIYQYFNRTSSKKGKSTSFLN